MSCSEWALNRWQLAIEAGDEKSANDYISIYELWKGRGM